VRREGCPPPRYRSLDPRVFTRRRPHRPLPPIRLGEPDALDRRGLGVPAAPALGEVGEVLVEVCRVLLPPHPVEAWRARRARPVLVQLGGSLYSVLSAGSRAKTMRSPAPNWRGICGTQY